MGIKSIFRKRKNKVKSFGDNEQEETVVVEEKEDIEEDIELLLENLEKKNVLTSVGSFVQKSGSKVGKGITKTSNGVFKTSQNVLQSSTNVLQSGAGSVLNVLKINKNNEEEENEKEKFPLLNLEIREKLRKEILDSIVTSTKTSSGKTSTTNNSILDKLKGFTGVFQIILFTLTSLSCFYLGSFKFSPIYLILFPISFYYIYTKLNNIFKKQLRNEIIKNIVKLEVFDNSESVNWINHIVQLFWFKIQNYANTLIIKTVNNILKENKPGFLESLYLYEFSLGTSAPRIEKIKIHHDNNNNDKLIMDLEFNFIPSLNESNNRICLVSRVGKGVIGINIPILVKDISLNSKIRIELDLISSLPFVKTVTVCLLESPEIDFVLKPLKSMDLMDLPLLNSFLFNLINENIDNVLVNPNKLIINI